MSETTEAAAPEGEGAIAARLDGLMSQLDGTEPIPREAEEPDEGEAPAEAAQPDADDEGEPETAIAPPPFWNKEAKTHWDAIPADTQGYLVEREAQRDAEVGRARNEATETRRAAHDQATALSQERAYLAQNIAPVLQQLTTYLQGPDFSPDAMANLARTNPAAWAEKSAERDQLVAVHQQIAGEQDRTREIEVRGEFARLLEHVPAWRDEKVRREDAGKLQTLAGEYGYSPAEVMAVIDHRALRILHELHVLRAEKAARAAPTRKVAQQQPASPLNGRSAPRPGQALDRASTNRIARGGDADATASALDQLLNRMG